MIKFQVLNKLLPGPKLPTALMLLGSGQQEEGTSLCSAIKTSTLFDGHVINLTKHYHQLKTKKSAAISKERQIHI